MIQEAAAWGEEEQDDEDLDVVLAELDELMSTMPVMPIAVSTAHHVAPPQDRAGQRLQPHPDISSLPDVVIDIDPEREAVFPSVLLTQRRGDRSGKGGRTKADRGAATPAVPLEALHSPALTSLPAIIDGDGGSPLVNDQPRPLSLPRPRQEMLVNVVAADDGADAELSNDERLAVRTLSEQDMVRRLADATSTMCSSYMHAYIHACAHVSRPCAGYCTMRAEP